MCSILSNCKVKEKPYRIILEAANMKWNYNSIIPLCSQLILFRNLIEISLNLAKNNVNNRVLTELALIIKKTSCVRFWEIDLSHNR